jgi:hypothetical protein
MEIKEILQNEIENLPDEYAGEIIDFIQFLKTKHTAEQRDSLLLSESSLRKDWLLPEEDKAWENL